MMVNDIFRELLLGLTPSFNFQERASSRIADIKRRLSLCFEGAAIERIGSNARGTMIPGVSDIDLFLQLPRKYIRWGEAIMSPDTVLNNVNSCLKDRYPKTDIRRDRQAIVIHFNDMDIDVVPSWFGGPARNGWPRYFMPDGYGKWMETNPKEHSSYLNKHNDASKGKLRGTAQLFKLWRLSRQNNVPISSFYIEMLLASSGVCRGVKSYGQCLYELFVLLHSTQCGGVDDPVGISRRISSTTTDAQRKSALASVRDARINAFKARRAEDDGKNREARYRWSLVFNHAIPQFEQ